MDGKLPSKLFSKKSEISYHMEIPTELNKDACVFDFDSMPTDILSAYINDLFEWWGYSLDEGTSYDGVYERVDELSVDFLLLLLCLVFLFLIGCLIYLLLIGLINFLKIKRNVYNVKIHEEEGRTYLIISIGNIGSLSKIYNYSFGTFNKEFHRIINEIKYPYNPDEGYLVCDNCRSYYALQPGEVPGDFSDTCDCGGKLRYFNNISWLFSKEESEPIAEEVLEERIKDKK